ncbi:hypothetical protein [Piscirickettsia litoralis]|uniref:hypothetical protein n=1 Tax=Piscirickettsia litoralis TaxID=1891921 RepID=UPI001912D298|nr:hypothetical protein [Piscirickettsia litoralis]
MTKKRAISIQNSFKSLKLLENRTPNMIDHPPVQYFSQLAEYRNGGIFIAHYRGNSE